MPSNQRRIEGRPEKDFFISMLTKDIELIRAIIDLVDNSVDGARRLRDNGSFRGLRVEVRTSSRKFEIVDNCGGIPVDIAREYAFRFGRPPSMPTTPRSVGEFGVGMKRALFKLGDKFVVESTSKDARFAVEVNVRSWKSRSKWDFRFSDLEPGTYPVRERGTKITVTRLHENVLDEFQRPSFSARLQQQLVAAHDESLGRGLTIVANGEKLKREPPRLLQSATIKPARRRKTFTNSHASMTVDLYAGLQDSGSDDNAGWNIYCNGRLVLAADQSSDTGWGERSPRKVRIPKYHPQFARFRGYAFFDCDDAGVLPWNTPKTGVDTNSGYYKATLLDMVDMTRPIITFLNRLDAEKESEVKPLEQALDKAHLTTLDNVKLLESFSAPAGKPTPEELKLVNIQYKKRRELVEEVKTKLGATSASVAGDRTFDYFYQIEVEE